MTQPAKGPEPSMDEILASIRRIIADEDPNKTAALLTAAELSNSQSGSDPAHAVLPPEPVMPPETEINAMMAQLHGTRQSPADTAVTDVLKLTEQQVVQKPASVGQPQARRQEPAAPPQPARAAEEQGQPAREIEGGLVSAATSAAVDSAFNTLAQTVLVQNARTLEDLVREMLRPMLKSWLDDNLPSLVERLVRAEIERIARGRG